MANFFKTIWALTGDKTAIPDDTQVDGSVSAEKGYTADYSANQATDPAAKPVGRAQWNWLFNKVTAALQFLQTNSGVPEYITAAENGGVAYQYSIGDRVKYNSAGTVRLYQSLVNNNASLPTVTADWEVLDSSWVVNLAITTAKLAAGAVTTSKIASSITLTTPTFSGDATVDSLKSSGSGGVILKNSAGTTAASFGMAGTTNGDVVGGWNVGGNLGVAGNGSFDGRVSGVGIDAGGFRNRFRNGNMDVWQRGTSGTITAGTPALTADGWYVGSTGANVPWAQVAGRASTLYALKVTGATSVTGVFFRQRIEAINCAVLYPNASAQVTVQAKIYNATGGSITPTLTVKHANAANNFGTMTTDVNAVSLQACPDATLTTVAYTFASASGAQNGLEVTIDCGNNFSTSGDSVEISEVDIRITPLVSTGLNASPPPIEYRLLSFEQDLCERYCQIVGNGFVGVAAGSDRFEGCEKFRVTMRAAPTAAVISGVACSMRAYSGIDTSAATPSLNAPTTSAQSIWTQILGFTGLTAGNGMQSRNASASQFILLTAEL